ncbi:cell envelope biogenesis protein TonB [Caballeronia hypogeia]|uniref:Cell envelope biogenesis protein TonB n=1 Tax=Caballeronia hypogeia TaxID=1777140 RepID=A0A157ZYE3_9BURK|nr:energy transducer TonB [Caballeronia hypogeia]SAK50489.1 cell envelope biogenesis protein TonB [Caballeronia hypogeia]
MSALRTGLTVFAIITIIAMSACTITPPPGVVAARTAAAPAVSGQTLDEYKHRIAQRIFERNPSLVLRGTPQAMLRSFVLVSFTVDSGGRLVDSSVYRTNGDDEAEATALASLRRASPLPAPPARLLNGHGQLELFEGWMFNDNGQFQLQTSHSPQATTID